VISPTFTVKVVVNHINYCLILIVIGVKLVRKVKQVGLVEQVTSDTWHSSLSYHNGSLLQILLRCPCRIVKYYQILRTKRRETHAKQFKVLTSCPCPDSPHSFMILGKKKKCQASHLIFRCRPINAGMIGRGSDQAAWWGRIISCN